MSCRQRDRLTGQEHRHSQNMVANCGTPDVYGTHSVDGKTALQHRVPEPSREWTFAGRANNINDVYIRSGLALFKLQPTLCPQVAAVRAWAEVERF